MTGALLDGVNWEIVAVFAALVLLEGLRRVPAGALVLTGSGPGGWRPQGEPELRPRWRLISWWSPVAPALLLPPLEGAPLLQRGDIEARLHLVRRLAPWLTVSAAATLLALIFGLPVVTARFGAVGFLTGTAVVLALAVINGAAGRSALRRLGPAPHRARILAWCSPFAAGRVLEGVFEAALTGASPAQAVRALAGETVFATWCRSRAYDVVFQGAEDPDLHAAADRATLEAIVASPPRAGAGGVSFCPRCAATWRLHSDACPACAVPLAGLPGV
ncbi:MAG TPA: hypothetical protein VH700_17130 [Gemmatimonadales bacterium]